MTIFGFTNLIKFHLIVAVHSYCNPIEFWFPFNHYKLWLSIVGGPQKQTLHE